MLGGLCHCIDGQSVSVVGQVPLIAQPASPAAIGSTKPLQSTSTSAVHPSLWEAEHAGHMALWRQAWRRGHFPLQYSLAEVTPESPVVMSCQESCCPELTYLHLHTHCTGKCFGSGEISLEISLVDSSREI